MLQLFCEGLRRGFGSDLDFVVSASGERVASAYAAIILDGANDIDTLGVGTPQVPILMVSLTLMASEVVDTIYVIARAKTGIALTNSSGK